MICDNCLKEMKEAHEVNDIYVCQDCLEQFNTKFDLLIE